jgi:hypothetical protein
MTTTPDQPSLAAWCAALTLTTLLGACGGGGGGDGGFAGVNSGGTGSHSNGEVTDFGSIVVNGIHFDQRNAKVTDTNNHELLPADIKLGMVVDLDGSSVSQTGGRQTADALTIRLRSALLGPVEARDATSLTIMGQKVNVSAGTPDKPGTRFGDGLTSGLGSISVGDLVEVYGFHDARQDVFVATRIERKSTLPVAQRYQVRGVIQDLDLVNNRCRIGRQLIDYKWVTGPGMVTPANGNVAVAWVSSTPSSQVRPDGSIQYVWAGQLMSVDSAVTPDKTDGSVDGLVTSVAAGTPGRFAVNGMAVDVSKIACGICASLRVGDHLMVRGSLTQELLTATSVTAADPF